MNISNFGIRLHTTTLISCPTLIFTEYLFFITEITQNLALQRYDTIKRKVAGANVESVNDLNLEFSAGSDIRLCVGLEIFK